jgi:phytoene dehydrogenase-like protein
MDEKRFDVIVAGAGLAGLIAGTLAAQGGARTLVVDRHPPGGRARTVDRDGFLFNQGPHAVYEAGALMRILKDLGLEPSGAQPAVSRTYLELADERHPLPAGPLSLATTRLLSARGRLAAARVLGRVRMLDPSRLAGRSVTTWFDDEELPPDAAALLLTLIRVSSYSNAPDIMDAGAAVGQLQAAMAKGVRYVDGGWGTIVRALIHALEKAGGRLRLGRGVDGVQSDGLSAIVQLGPSELRARAVVLAGLPPLEVARVLGSEPAWLANLGPAVEVTCLGLALVKAPDPCIVFGVDRPLYLSTHAPTAALAPPGRAIVEIMKYLAPPGAEPGDDSASDTCVDDDRRELESFGRRVGIDGADVLDQRYLRRMTVSHALPIARNGGLLGRPQVTASGLENVLLAGDWVGPNGLLSDAAAASAHMAADRALRLVQPARVS